MRAKKEECYIVCVSNPDGFIETNYFQIRDLFVDAKTDYWEYLNPHTFIAFFLQRKDGHNRVNYLISKIEDLKNNSPIHANIGIGSSVGKLIIPFSLLGKIKGKPIGTEIDNAIKIAKQNIK
ncbi:MAG: hypothetical protein ABSD46_12070 [Bacteroidota bacterium]